MVGYLLAMPRPTKKATAKKSAKKIIKKVIKKVIKTVTKKVAKKPSKKTASTKALKSRAKKPASSKGRSIVETSSVTWSSAATGPSFDQVQLAAYHRWVQGGASDLDNWLSAEGDLRGKKS